MHDDHSIKEHTGLVKVGTKHGSFLGQFFMCRKASTWINHDKAWHYARGDRVGHEPTKLVPGGIVLSTHQGKDVKNLKNLNTYFYAR